MIVIAGIQIIDTGLDVFLCIGNVGIETEKALVTDQTARMELVFSTKFLTELVA